MVQPMLKLSALDRFRKSFTVPILVLGFSGMTAQIILLLLVPKKKLRPAGGKNIDGLTGASRSAPSAGGIYPVEIYLVAGRVKGLCPGIYRYSWQDHSLHLEKAGDHRVALAVAALNQGFIARAPICLVLTAYYRKTESKYGQRGILRYVPMDAGHAAQNVCLQAEAPGLGAVPVGAFLDREVEKVLDRKTESHSICFQ